MRLVICHLNKEDMAGLSARLSKAINIYTDHKSYSFKAINNYLDFEADRLIDDPEFALMIQEANILVFNEIYYPLSAHWQDIPTIMIHHGTWYRNHLESSKKLDNDADLILGTALGLLELDSRMLWLPSIVDIDWLQKFKSEPKYEVLHTTTSWVKKRTDLIVQNLPGIKVIENMSYEEAMQEKGKARIVVDQVSNRGIGLGAIEAMAMGIPTISVISGEVLSRYKKLVGYVPFISVGKPEDLPKAIEYVKENYEHLSNISLEHTQKYHSMEVCAERFVKICLMVLQSKKIKQKDLIGSIKKSYGAKEIYSRTILG